ncbi:MAG: 1,2-phenylacetyl-CoA epoxidase subunit PaaD, partial [Flavobacteriales bacterium]
DIWKLLELVEDPEVPVLDVVNMGVARNVEIEGNKVIVTITPTYSGCPAMDVIGHNVKKVLSQNGVQELEVKTTLSPAWTTDWLTDIAKQRLKEYGIAPPVDGSPDKSKLLSEDTVVPCPNCDSEDTIMVSAFGSTSCKAHYKCNSCLEPFDYFKCL